MASFWRILLGIVLSMYLCLNILQSYLNCNHSNYRNTCSNYYEGKVTGQLCSAMCDANRDKLKDCLTNRPDKQVFDATLDSHSIILKYSTKWSAGRIKWETELTKDSLTNEANRQTEFEDKFSVKVVSAVESIVVKKFGNCAKCRKLVLKLVQMADHDQNMILNITEGVNLLAHLEDHEAFMLMTLNGSQHSLSFHGYCGGFYSTEKLTEISQNVYGFIDPLLEHYLPYIFPGFLEPFEELLRHLFHPLKLYFSRFDIFDHFYSWNYKTFYETRTPEWRERFNFTYGLLDILHEVQRNEYGPIHFCDLHTGNIGLTENKSYKIIDYDVLMPKYLASKELSLKECATNKDCALGDYQDCIGVCNTAKGTCRQIIIPHDLNLLCRTLIGSSLTEHAPGLLGYNPTQTEMANRAPFLRAVIQKCREIPIVSKKDEILRNIENVKKMFQEIEEMQFRIFDDDE